MKLVIISHTEHFLKNGEIVGWGPTVREIDYLSSLFDTIIHVAVLHPNVDEIPNHVRPYTSKTIEFRALLPYGGKRFFDKLSIISTLPTNFSVIHKAVTESDYFHFRAPTGIGVWVIPYLSFMSSKPGWFKYAGNWMDRGMTVGYRFQKALLKFQKKHIVTANTIKNDSWPQVLAFENPCLTEEDRKDGEEALKTKTFTKPYKFCFVGRLEYNKGIDVLMEALKDMNPRLVDCLHIVGEGSLKDELVEIARSLSFNVFFHNYLPKQDVFKIYSQSNFIILPSVSEGFPKVIAEAMNFGCIPIVSDVSVIRNYISKDIGYLVDPNDRLKSLESILKHINLLKSYDIVILAENCFENSKVFSFKRYLERIKKEILKLE